MYLQKVARFCVLNFVCNSKYVLIFEFTKLLGFFIIVNVTITSEGYSEDSFEVPPPKLTILCTRFGNISSPNVFVDYHSLC